MCFHLVRVCIFVRWRTGNTTIPHLHTSLKKHFQIKVKIVSISYLIHQAHGSHAMFVVLQSRSKRPAEIQWNGADRLVRICWWELQGFIENSLKKKKRERFLLLFLQEVKSASMCFLMAGIRDTVWGSSRRTTLHPSTSLEIRLNLWVCGLVSLVSSSFSITHFGNTTAVWLYLGTVAA